MTQAYGQRWSFASKGDVSIWVNNSQNPFQKLIFSTLMKSKTIEFYLFKKLDEVLLLLLILKEVNKRLQYSMLFMDFITVKSVVKHFFLIKWEVEKTLDIKGWKKLVNSKVEHDLNVVVNCQQQ